MEIDMERLREDLKIYYGTATAFFPNAYIDLFEVENANNDKLIELAISNNFNLNNYIINVKDFRR